MTESWSENALLQLEEFGSGPMSILVRLDRQELYLFQDRSLVRSYPVSCSRYGAGCRQDSQCTPTGVHCIAEKIGRQCQYGEILKARKPTGEIADIIAERRSGDDDVITSRILWLRGLQPGINQGDGVDSYRRYIYIHGTNEEGLIGQPASIGCIRMKNDAVIDLFDRVEAETLVSILSG